MRKLNFVLSTSLLMLAGIFPWETYARGSLPDETRSESQQLARGDLDEKKPPRNDDPAGSRAQLPPWQELYEKYPSRNFKPGGSRGGDQICPIAPAVPGKTRVIWSDHPLFLWQGNIGKIEVHPHDSEEVLWSQTFSEPDGSTIYGGKALQPEQSYDEVIFDRREHLLFIATFQVMPREKRDRIAADLISLQVQRERENATSEQIAYANADYFAKRQMWVDALQEAYSVKNPSEALTKFKINILHKICDKS